MPSGFLWPVLGPFVVFPLSISDSQSGKLVPVFLKLCSFPQGFWFIARWPLARISALKGFSYRTGSLFFPFLVTKYNCRFFVSFFLEAFSSRFASLFCFFFNVGPFCLQVDQPVFFFYPPIESLFFPAELSYIDFSQRALDFSDSPAAFG